MGRKIKHDYKKIVEYHNNGQSIMKISKELKISIGTIYNHFRRNKIPYNKEIPPRRVGYTVNDNYLDDIDTERKAYFLGWMFSDGYVNRNRITLKLEKYQ